MSSCSPCHVTPHVCFSHWQALSNKSQHSISYTLSRSHSVIVEYTHDTNTDMFQVSPGGKLEVTKELRDLYLLLWRVTINPLSKSLCCQNVKIRHCVCLNCGSAFVHVSFEGIIYRSGINMCYFSLNYLTDWHWASTALSPVSQLVDVVKTLWLHFF